MVLLLWTALGGYALVVAGWWLRHVLLCLPRRLGMIIEPAPGPDPGPRLSVVVPARNERERIGPCIRSLLAQGPVVREVLVVDDRSDDGTGEYVRQLAGGDPRVRVLRVDELPPGWSGKAHACDVGGRAATGDWILFTDADCHFLDGGLAAAVRYAEQHDVDFLTLWLRADHRSFWEHMLIPLCGALILYWFPPFGLGRSRWCPPYATGQFILIRREAWLRIDGHRAARDAVIEDIPLARHARRSGLRMRTALGAEVVAVRMYRSLGEIWNGWTRIFIGALQRRWKLLWSVVSVLGGSLMPSLVAPLAAGFVLTAGWPSNAALAAAITLVWLHAAAVYSVSARTWRLCHCDRRYLLLYPVSCVVVTAILLRAWWWMVRRRPIVWRGSVTGPRPQAANAGAVR